MRAYLCRRLLQSIIVLLGITLIVFFILHLSGEPTRLLLPIDATKEDIEVLRHELGFDKPLYIQYLKFMKGVIQGDFGNSLRHNESAFFLVLERLPATFELALTALSISVIFAIPIGVFSAFKPNSTLDNIGMAVVLFGQSMPVFWSGLMLILLFSVKFQIFPAFGRGGIANLVMPSVSIGFFFMARIARVTRSSMIGVLKKDYVRTAKSKGLTNNKVIIRHAFKNASLPIITMVGLDLGRLLGGSVLTETIFSWPGVGRLAIQAIYNRDFPVVQAAVFVLAVIFIIINLIVDILYTYIDPRIRYE